MFILLYPNAIKRYLSRTRCKLTRSLIYTLSRNAMVKWHFLKKPFNNHTTAYRYHNELRNDCVVVKKPDGLRYDSNREQHCTTSVKHKIDDLKWLCHSKHQIWTLVSSVNACLFTILRFVHEKLAMSKWIHLMSKYRCLFVCLFFLLLNYSKLKYIICMWNSHA